ncbi:MAG: nodulation protein NfeD, partial [Thermoanaerobaculales bacterium]|nr:nodulation protein NfeD [Thermoanaerobaculales bacterium]
LVASLVAMSAALPGWCGEVVRMRVDDTIQPASQQFIERVLLDASESGASVVVMELDTPGGLVDTTRDITSAIMTSPVPVVVFVNPSGARAASAGFFILLSADVAVMAPGTNTGAAHPVSGQGEDLQEDLRDKATNDVAAMVRSLAAQRGRNAETAEKAVRESISLTADEALEEGLIDFIAKDFNDLLDQLEGWEITRPDGSVESLDLADRSVIEFEPTFAEKLFSVLANPNIAYLLMALGALGLYVEISHPGGILPGVVGVIFLLLGLYSVSVLPVSWAGVALIFVAMMLFILEVKVTSYGLLTVGGVISFVLGSLMLFDGPIPALRVSAGVVLPTAVVVASATVFLLTRVLKAYRQQPMTGKEGLVGEVGRVIGEFAPVGKVVVHGEYWDARSVGGTVAVGNQVRVLTVYDRSLDVAALDDSAEGSS